MLNGRGTFLGFIGIIFVLSVTSTVLGQSVEVLKSELKGTEGRLDTKIDGVKNELNASITGVKNELKTSIDRVKSEVVTIKWIIGGIGTIFLGSVYI